ncbi:MAG: peptide chain release factor N(5)-glutamine methyltransferase [Candidatus Omnitrophica bacterium]|nr:peptide chain release factor N(5)-glutamine methyltransferase [Candidatus Omnitrophota bacterium]
MAIGEEAEMTISSCLKKGARFLEAAGVPEARTSAEFLLSHVMGQPRFSFYAEPDAAIKPAHAEEFQKLLSRRSDRFPLQYLLKSVPFRNVVLEVGEGCLIPRPETEILAEIVLRTLDEETGGHGGPPLQILDVGTGSGNIAISVAKERSHWQIIATDISDQALHYARRNAVRNEVQDNIQFLQTDLWDGISSLAFDAIVSNPPYLTTSELSRLQPEVRFEPEVALDGGENGLSFFKRIARNATMGLKRGGFLFFEIGFGQDRAVFKILEDSGFREIKIFKDDGRIKRIISARLGSTHG